jgi:hypothetical protein
MKTHSNMFSPYDFVFNLIAFQVCPLKYLLKHIHNSFTLSTNKEIVFEGWPMCPDFCTVLYIGPCETASRHTSSPAASSHNWTCYSIHSPTDIKMNAKRQVMFVLLSVCQPSYFISKLLNEFPHNLVIRVYTKMHLENVILFRTC